MIENKNRVYISKYVKELEDHFDKATDEHLDSECIDCERLGKIQELIRNF